MPSCVSIGYYFFFSFFSSWFDGDGFSVRVCFLFVICLFFFSSMTYSSLCVYCATVGSGVGCFVFTFRVSTLLNSIVSLSTKNGVLSLCSVVLGIVYIHFELEFENFVSIKFFTYSPPPSPSSVYPTVVDAFVVNALVIVLLKNDVFRIRRRWRVSCCFLFFFILSSECRVCKMCSRSYAYCLEGFKCGCENLLVYIKIWIWY